MRPGFLKIVLFAAIAAIGGVLFFAFPSGTKAQTAGQPQLYISWEASTYAPPGYTGKILPTIGSQVNMWAYLVGNGKVLDVSGDSIEWYVDQNIIKSGNGADTATFKLPLITGQIMDLSVKLSDPSTGFVTSASMQIPVMSPVAVIEGPGIAEGAVSSQTIDAKAVPYFFNVSDLSNLTYEWSVNGNTAQSAENPQQATINLGSSVSAGTQINIKLSISNTKDSTAASANANVTYE